MRDELMKLDPALAAALDRLSVPPLPGDFADRVAARAAARGTMPSLPDFRGRGRGRWSRGRSILVGVAAFSLVSAAAAATGVFGPISRETPVIGPILASVAPAVVAKPKPVVKPKPRLVAPAPQLAEAVVPPPPGEVAPLPSTDRVETRAALIAERLERRAERRAARGLPPKPIARRQIRKALADMTPEERKAVRERVRELRRHAIAGTPEGRIVGEADGPAGLTERPRAVRFDRLDRLERINARRARKGLPPLTLPNQAGVAEPSEP